jgi:thiol-disulfide isomerase/thioredoxin
VDSYYLPPRLGSASLITALIISLCTSSFAATLDDEKAVPHLDRNGKEAYRVFLNSQRHRAFAIAPGGTWGWKGAESSIESAAEEALLACQIETEQKCVLYATNDDVVFDSQAWARSWQPYADNTAAKRAPIGIARGDRFYDLRFKDSAGKLIRLSELRGKVVLLHFWGSWCPPCQRELPELLKLQRALSKSSNIKMVLLQVREDFDTSRKAIARQRLNLQLHDSGAKDSKDDTLTLADGSKLKDRDIAAVFPTTYVIDKHGIVLFSHNGPVHDWLGYLPLLKDAVTGSGK